jgi:hypothetical protein
MHVVVRPKLILAVYCSLLMIVFGCNRSAPGDSSDAQLEIRLIKYRTDFDQLIKMADEDRGVARIAEKFYKLNSNNSSPIFEPADMFSRTRWDQYRKLFQRLDLKNGLMRLPEYPNVIFLVPFENVLIQWGSESYDKGFAYSPQPLSPSMDSLDNPNPIRQKNTFKHLMGNWNLYVIKVD